MATALGIDRLFSTDFAALKSRRVGWVCNQASVATGWDHGLHHARRAAASGTFEIVAAFGPQHGIWGHTQDNMIEWTGYRDEKTGLTFYSLYGEHRKPTPEMLAGMDTLVIDLPDVGARYYTFVWTMALCMEACHEQGISVMILDRPNPLRGDRVGGTMLDPALSSFVGLHPIPTQHGLTIGELARLLKTRYFPNLDLQIVEMGGWSRAQDYDAAGAPWVMTSPNMPTVDTAWVYPGMCLFEGTNVSEGRGTTRPFEMFGAPWVDGDVMCAELNALALPGVHFRPVTFQPTFHKFAGEVCEGAFIHVTNRAAYQSTPTGVAILHHLRRYPGFAYKDPPYEYVWDRDPIDILLGQYWLRQAIDEQQPLGQIFERMDAESRGFHDVPEVRDALLYT
jgi:uncharacterized protein YbbC (DUF1343 family)